MTQRILIEILLFLIPFAVFLVYRAASRDLRVRDRWPLTRLVIIGGVIAVLGTENNKAILTMSIRSPKIV